jgi:hypothetical protein
MGLSTERPSFEQTMDEMHTQLSNLEREIDILDLANTTTFTLCNRFFATFRAKVKPLSPADRNTLADDYHHNYISIPSGGDPLLDAVMFRKGIRTDDRTFCLLYGIPWHRVLDYGT